MKNKTLNICMVSDDYNPAVTGVGTHLKTIIPELVKLGHRIVVITTSRPGLAKFSEENGVRVYRVASLKVQGYYQALPKTREIEKILTENRIDLVHHHYLGIMLMKVFKVAEKMNIRQVYTYHLNEDILSQSLTMRPFRGLIRSLCLKYYNKFDMIMAPSKVLTERVQTLAPKTPMRFVTNPVAFSEIDHQLLTAPIRGEKFTLLFAGRLSPEKNIPFLIKGFKELYKKYGSRIELRIAGEGELRSSLEGLCKKLGIQDGVKFLGHLPHSKLGQEYANADVFVLPSYSETQGLVALEAMKFGKPLIVSDSIVSATELVDEGKNGFIVKADDVLDFSLKAQQLIENKSLTRDMGLSSLMKSANYACEKVMGQIMDCYSLALGLGSQKQSPASAAAAQTVGEKAPLVDRNGQL